MDDINATFYRFRQAAIMLESKRCNLCECPDCHKPYNLIHKDESKTICLNCGRTVFHVGTTYKMFKGIGLFMVVKDTGFQIGAISEDDWENACKNVVNVCQETLHSHPNDCDYFILHSYKNGETKNIDFKDML